MDNKIMFKIKGILTKIQTYFLVFIVIHIKILIFSLQRHKIVTFVTTLK